MRRINLTGQRFGRWTVLSFIGMSGGQARWLCRCDCGATGSTDGSALRRGQSQSCGCLRTELKTTHGMYGTPMYRVWAAMLRRCENPNVERYPRYGGRGIHVCERWHNFSAFYTDLMTEIGPRPLGKSLDRINNDGHYEPRNVRWATQREQWENSHSNPKPSK
jgi:hypothetical protein